MRQRKEAVLPLKPKSFEGYSKQRRCILFLAPLNLANEMYLVMKVVMKSEELVGEKSFRSVHYFIHTNSLSSHKFLSCEISVIHKNRNVKVETWYLF